MKRLVIKLVDMKQVESVEESGENTPIETTTIRKVWEESDVIVEANHDISEFIDSNSAYNVIKRLAGKMIELEILRQQAVVTEAREEIDTMTQSEVEDIFNDMIDECYIDLHDFSASVNRN